MKKIYLFFAFALLAIAASAQSPLYTVETTVVNDESWGDEWASYFVFRGTKVQIEVYDEDYVIVKNWGGVEGVDLKVEYDPNIVIDDNCLGNIISVSNIYNGEEQEPVLYEGYSYFYTGRDDNYSVCASALNEDGTLYWSFVSVDKENQTGSVLVGGYYTDANYSSWSEQSYYFAEWPEAVKPLYTVETTVVNDESWGDEWASYFVFRGTKVQIEVYDEDYVIVKNWGGVEGIDLKVEYDPNIVIDDNCLGNIISVSNIYNGEEQEPVLYGGYNYFYTGRDDNYSVCASALNEDGTLYWSFVSVDKENQAGSVLVGGYYTDANYSSWSEQSYYFAEWPEAEKEPVFYGTFKGNVVEYLDEDGNVTEDYGEAMMKDYSVDIDVYDQYIIIHDYSNTPNKPRDLKLTCDGNGYVTSLVHTLVSSGKETDLTQGGYLYTGFSSVDGADYIYCAYVYDCAEGCNFAEWDETSGFVMLCVYAYFKDAEGNILNDQSDWRHYYVYWYKEEVEAQKLYSAEGEFISQENSGSGYLYLGEKATVEVYDNNTIYVRNFAGVEGHDLVVSYDEAQNVTAVAQVVDGVQGTATTAGWFTFEPGNGATHYIWIGNGYCYATSRNNSESGYVFLYVYNENNDNGDYIYISWPATQTGIANVENESTDNGAMYNLFGIKVDESYKGIVVKNGKKMILK